MTEANNLANRLDTIACQHPYLSEALVLAAQKLREQETAIATQAATITSLAEARRLANLREDDLQAMMDGVKPDTPITETLARLREFF